jgi:hypothetical protein
LVKIGKNSNHNILQQWHNLPTTSLKGHR